MTTRNTFLHRNFGRVCQKILTRMIRHVFQLDLIEHLSLHFFVRVVIESGSLEKDYLIRQACVFSSLWDFDSLELAKMLLYISLDIELHTSPKLPYFRDQVVKWQLSVYRRFFDLKVIDFHTSIRILIERKRLARNLFVFELITLQRNRLYLF